MPMSQSITEEFPVLDGDDDKIVKRLIGDGEQTAVKLHHTRS
jgi:hypothetical protein